MDYNIISTGSQGNAAVINSTVLIDCGVPFKALKGVYKALRLVLLTHIHTDHFNKATIKKLACERPALRFGCHIWMAGHLLDAGVNSANIDIYVSDGVYAYDHVTVGTFDLYHNVPNCGYKLFYDHETVIYATDTNSLQHVTAKHFTLYMIEANYTESEMLERIQRKQANGEHIYEYDVMNNHLSKEKADDWLYANMGPNSEYIYMHRHVE